MSFLHSRRPRAIVHAALNSSSVLIDERHNAKLTDFFHAGCVGDPFTVISKSHKLPEFNTETKLHTSFDMLCLGSIVKAIDADVKNREHVPGERNILKKLYALCDSKDGPPQDLTACEVRRRLASYLENPAGQRPQQQQRRQEAQHPQQLSVKLILVLIFS